MRLLVLACFSAAVLVLPWACPAMAQSKHFTVSQRHFEELANKAADLSATMDSPGEKNACNFYTATAMIYATRAHALAQLTAMEERMRLPEDHAFARDRIAETGEFSLHYLVNDLKALEGLASSTGNGRIKDLGLRLVNELRVFGHNAESVVKN